MENEKGMFGTERLIHTHYRKRLKEGVTLSDRIPNSSTGSELLLLSPFVLLQ